MRDPRDGFRGVGSHLGRGTRENSSNIGVALELMLTKKLDPSVIESIACQEAAEELGERDHPWGTNITNLGNGSVLRHHIDTSPWITKEEYDDFFQVISRNNKEAA